MNFKPNLNREIEKKFTVEGISFNEVSTILLAAFGFPDTWQTGIETEYYHEATSNDVDFIRVRTYPDGSGMFTIKKKDQQTNQNRFELEVNLPAEDAKELALRLSGPEIVKFERRFIVIDINQHVSVAAYLIEGIDKVFVEVEGSTIYDINKATLRIPPTLELIPEPSSIWELYVKPILYRYRSIP